MKVAWESRLDVGAAAAYDAFVAAAPSGHACQTTAWAAVAGASRRVSPSFVTVLEGSRLVGAALVLRPRVGGIHLPWAWIERGPVVEDPSMLGPCLRGVERAARKAGILRLRVMPYWSDDAAAIAERDLVGRGYRDVQQASGAHARTVRVPLDEDAHLLGGPGMGRVRWRARQASRYGATARLGGPGDWTELRAMHTALMRSQRRSTRGAGWWAALEAFLSDHARGSLFVCEFEGRLVSACVALRHAGQVTYAWGASVPDALPFTKAIPSLVETIRWARANGCTRFDLGGVPLEEDRDPKRAAIAMLKRDFGRPTVRLVREHARWLVP